MIARVAVPVPLHRYFDYFLPVHLMSRSLPCGARVRVPFGSRILVGILLDVQPQTDEVLSQRAGKGLKEIINLLDDESLFDEQGLKLIRWMAGYYHRPFADVALTTLPVWLREGRALESTATSFFRLTELGSVEVLTSTAKRQRALLEALKQQALSLEQLRSVAQSAAQVLARLQEKGWVERFEQSMFVRPEQGALEIGPELEDEQSDAVKTVCQSLGRFHAYLLEGVTGSGKTEVYLRIISEVLERGQQALVLVPEIGLTPQLVSRFEQRFSVPIVTLHSNLTDKQRLQRWTGCRNGEVSIVIGTRSAVFTPMPQLGVIVVDEEHDLSFKQQDGFRYSARDVAVVRANMLGIPVLLGSATPSLESVNNVLLDRYQRLSLTIRAGGASEPSIHMIDMRSEKSTTALSNRLKLEMKQTLEQGHQVMLFLNRRGFAPVVNCFSCGWIASCPRCDCKLTYHQQKNRLRCHLCGFSRALVSSCGRCGSEDLHPLGVGTEKVEAEVSELFAGTEVIRIDRDTVQRKEAFDQKIERVYQGNPLILLGTQMIAKGHHFPQVTLVAMLNVDEALFSPDFRAPERMAQLVLQVAGRAGRAQLPGRVYIQTRAPDSSFFSDLFNQGYAKFSQQLLLERRAAQLPPVSFWVMFRATSRRLTDALNFLQAVKRLADAASAEGCGQLRVYGPAPDTMEKHHNRYHAHLVFEADSRLVIQRVLTTMVPAIDAENRANRVRWSIDVDPLSNF